MHSNELSGEELYDSFDNQRELEDASTHNRTKTHAGNTLVTRDLDLYLPMWPSGLSTRAPCAVERDKLCGRGLNLSPGASAYQRIISNNSYARDD